MQAKPIRRGRGAFGLSAGLVALSLTALTSAPSPAQDSRPAQDTRPLSFSGALRAEGEYNDNFFRSEKGKQEDFRESLIPDLHLRLSTGRSQAEVSYSPSLVHSSVNEGEVQVFHLFNASGSLPLSERFTLTASDRLLRSDEPTLTDPRGLARDRRILLQNTLTSLLTYKRDTWSLAPHYAVTFNETEGGRASSGTVTTTANEQSTVHALGVDGTRDIGERNVLGAGYELTVGEFKVAPDFVGHTGRLSFSRQLSRVTTASVLGSIDHRDVQGGSHFNIYKGDVGIRREVSPRYAVEARVGYQATDISGGQDEPSFSLSGTYTGKSIRLSLTSGQSIQETFLERTNVGPIRARENAFEARYEPTDRLVLIARGGVTENRFLQSSGTTTGGPQRKRKDLLLNGGLECSFRLTRLLFLTLGYTYANVDSNVPGLDFENNVVRLGLTVSYK